MRPNIISMLILLTVSAEAMCENSSRVHVVPPGRDRSYDEYHYSPLVVLGDRVIVSGIPASRGSSDEEKIRGAFEQLRFQLAAAGASLDDVIEIQSFHVAQEHEAFQSQIQTTLSVHREFFANHYPAWTAVGVTALLAPGAPMEIRAEAIVGSGREACLVRQVHSASEQERPKCPSVPAAGL